MFPCSHVWELHGTFKNFSCCWVEVAKRGNNQIQLMVLSFFVWFGLFGLNPLIKPQYKSTFTYILVSTWYTLVPAFGKGRT
jgi:hypothetical protein